MTGMRWRQRDRERIENRIVSADTVKYFGKRKLFVLRKVARSRVLC